MRPSKFKKIEKEKGRPIAEILSELYEELGTQTAVAARIGVSQSRLSTFLKERGLREKTILVPERNGS